MNELIFINNMKANKVKRSLDVAKKEIADLLPDCFKDEFLDKSFIGGGAIYSLWNKQEPKDYDFFLTNDDIVVKIRNHFEQNNSLKYKNGVKIGTYKGNRLVVTDNAISIGKYQIITRWVGSPEKVIIEFDFLHNLFYYYNGKLGTLTKWKYLDDNYLRFNDARPRDICGCIIRTKKFIERGFKLTNKEMAKMLLKLNEVGFNDREVEILNYHDSDERNDFGS